MEVKGSEAQARHREVGSEGSVEQRYGPMDKNRIGGLRRRTSWQLTTKSVSIKDAGVKSGGRVSKAAELIGESQKCYMIGDGIPDLLAGTRAGCRTIFIGRWKCEICQFTEAPHVHAALVAESLWDAALLIQAEMQGTKPIALSHQCDLSAQA